VAGNREHAQSADDYFGVDITIVWKVVRSDLADLGESIDKILATMPRS